MRFPVKFVPWRPWCLIPDGSTMVARVPILEPELRLAREVTNVILNMKNSPRKPK
jgi:hypothetical protein